MHSKIISAHPEFAMEDDFKLLVEGELWTNRKVNKVIQITEDRIIIDENIRFWSL